MYVGVGSHPLQHVAVLVPDRYRMGMEPAVDSVSPLEAQFSIEGVDTSQGPPPLLGDSRAVFGVDVGDPALTGLSAAFPV